MIERENQTARWEMCSLKQCKCWMSKKDDGQKAFVHKRMHRMLEAANMEQKYFWTLAYLYSFITDNSAKSSTCGFVVLESCSWI